MMKLTCNDTLYTYDAYHLLKAFYPDEEIEQQVNEEQESQVRIETDRDSCFCVSLAGEKGEIGQMDRSRRKHLVVSALYEKLSKMAGKKLPWGSLTGVRPTKMFMQKLEEGVPDQEILNWIEKEHFVSEEKAELGLAIAKREKELLSRLDYENGYSLYIGIPFCPTTCAYCSFTSYPIAQYLDRMDDYLDALCRELSYIADVSKEKKLNTIYLGGGTPTSLSASRLDRLLTHLEQQFSYEHLLELTVEAGRPDTITAEKLAVLARRGCSRVSVNPQTMQDAVLERMGRAHRADDILRAYALARESGIGCINMDLIAGLPGDSAEGFRASLEQVLDLGPENVTVHTLALKKGSRLMEEGGGLPSGAAVADMLDFAWAALRGAGQRPYYLYRQKYMSGSFENVGWCRPGAESLYNICMMEELHTIVSLGGGGVTKLVDRATGYIERLANAKYPQEYIQKIDAICADKGRVAQFYAAHGR